MSLEVQLGPAALRGGGVVIESVVVGTLPPMIASAAALGEKDTPRARRRDRITSHEAADTSDVKTSIGLVLRILNDAMEPLTDEEIEVRAALAPHFSEFTGQRLRTARRHLERLELVEAVDPVGGLTSRGRRCATWQAVK